MQEKPFEVKLSVDGVNLRFTADSVSYDTNPPEGWADYFLAPVEDERKEEEMRAAGVSESEIHRVLSLRNCRCEVGDRDTFSFYVSRGALRALCPDHAEGVHVVFERLRIPEPVIERPSQNGISIELNERQQIHRLMEDLENRGMTRVKISEELKRQGFTEVSRRTVDKHLRKECACFPSDVGA